MTLILATTAYSFVYVNEEFIHQWGEEHPKHHVITLNKYQLQCGCNVLKVIVYNYDSPSPCGLSYKLTQKRSGCKECTA